MKTYLEMADSALERIKSYKEKRKKTEKKVIVSAVSLCFAVMLGCIIHYGGLIKQNNPKHDQDSKTDNKINSETVTEDVGSAIKDTQNFADAIGYVFMKDGSCYVQRGDADASLYTKGEYLGKASDYEGLYKNNPDVPGNLYRSKEDKKVLLLFLENGATIVLEEDLPITERHD